ncbi:transcriptional repressor, partial [Xanthomonas citri pv. citri]|nr:transcriptional repressor [Xanthomonas citri pv. citri]
KLCDDLDGYQVSGQKFEIYGTCPDCTAENQENTTA